MKFRTNLKQAALAALISTSVIGSANADSYLWTVPSTGTVNWNAAANWSPNTAFPNAPGDIANLNINITANQNGIGLNIPITVGSVIFGDSSGGQQQTITAGTAGSLIFNNLGSTATLTRGTAGTGGSTVSAKIALVDDLDVTNLSTGVLTLSGSISGNKSLSKFGTGPVTISASNIYTGNTIINAGTLTFANTAIPFGPGYGDVVINSGATISPSSGTSINGLSGTGTFAALTRNITAGFDGSPVNFSGTYTSTATFSIQSEGLNVFSSPNANAIAPTTIRTTRPSGIMRFDYNAMATPTNMVAPAVRLGATGGTAEIYGKTDAATSQTFLDYLINPTAANDQTIKLTPNGTGTVILTFTNPNILRGAGNTLNYVVPVGASVLTGIGPVKTTNGLFDTATDVTTNAAVTKQSGFAVFNGSTWATTSGNSIVGLSTYTPSNGPVTGTDNVDVITDTSLIGNGATVVNSLRFNSPAGNLIQLGATDTLLLNSGGLLVTADRGVLDTVITGGTITGNAGGLNAVSQGSTTTAELIIHQHNTAAFLQIDSVIANNGAAVTGLTKGGPGTLVLSKANTYTGTTFLGGGTTKLAVADAIPHVFGGGGVSIGGTLDLNGFSPTFNGMDVRVSGKVTNSSASDVTLTIGENNGTGSYGGGGVTVEDGTGGGKLSVVKIGTGAFTSLSPVTYTGGTTIQAGAVNLGNAGVAIESTSTAGLLGMGLVTLNGGVITVSSTTALSNNTLINNVASGGIVFDNLTAPWTLNAFTFGGLSGSGDIVLANNAATPAAIALSVGNNNATPAAYTGALSGAGSFTKVGTGTTTLGGTNTYTGNTTVSAGTLNITGNHTTGANYSVASSAALVTNNVRVTNALTVNGTATINTNGGTAGASKVETLTIGAGGKLNLKDNDLVVGTAANVTAVRAAIKTGIAGSIGITSDLPAFTVTTGFGYALGNDSAISPLLAGSLTGQTYDADSVLVKYTFLGDADLDGDSDLNDLGLWAQSFTGDLGNPAIPATYWTSGDFDYDGDTDLNDLGFWAGTFTGDLGGGAGSLIVNAPGAPADAVAALNSMGITVVPEPSTFVLAGVGLTGLAIAARRRKK